MLGTRQADPLSTVSRCYSIVLTDVFDLNHPVTNLPGSDGLDTWLRLGACVGSGEWGCESVVRIRGLIRTEHFRIRTSLVCGLSDPRRLAPICVCGLVRFGFGRNKFVQLLIRSRNSSNRFVRSLIPTIRPCKAIVQ